MNRTGNQATLGEKRAGRLIAELLEEMVGKRGISERDVMAALGTAAGTSIAIDYGTNGDLGEVTLQKLRDALLATARRGPLSK